MTKRRLIVFALLAWFVLMTWPFLTFAAPRSNPLARCHPSGLNLARALQAYAGSRAVLTVRALPHRTRRIGRLFVEERVWARFVPDARGAGEIQLSPQLVILLNRAARGYRTRRDLLTLYVILHECAHSLSPRRHRLELSDRELEAEEAYARWRGIVMRNQLLRGAR